MDLNNYGVATQRSGVWRSLRDGEFEEEDVWDVLKNRRDKSGSFNSSDISINSSIKTPAAARMIPSGSSSRFKVNHSSDSWHETRFVQQSAPVKIPGLSKVTRKTTRKETSQTDARPWCRPKGEEFEAEEDDSDLDGVCHGNRDTNAEEEAVDAAEDERLIVPPHELIARRLARSHISFSVVEGVGRTLKGRDLRKVRNAVLIRTGFLESL